MKHASHEHAKSTVHHIHFQQYVTRVLIHENKERFSANLLVHKFQPIYTKFLTSAQI